MAMAELTMIVPPVIMMSMVMMILGMVMIFIHGDDGSTGATCYDIPSTWECAVMGWVNVHSALAHLVIFRPGATQSIRWCIDD